VDTPTATTPSNQGTVIAACRNTPRYHGIVGARPGPDHDPCWIILQMYYVGFLIVTGEWVIIEACGKYIGRRVAVTLRIRRSSNRWYREILTACLSALGVLFDVMWCPMHYVIDVSSGECASISELARVHNLWFNNEWKVPGFHQCSVTISKRDDAAEVTPQSSSCVKSCAPHFPVRSQTQSKPDPKQHGQQFWVCLI
jgi:hypothetical protein